MSVKLLERRAVQSPEAELQVLESEVMDKAQRVLGYKVGEQLRSTAQVQVQAQKALDRCGIVPFTPKSVARYKRKMVWKARWSEAWIPLAIGLGLAGVGTLLGYWWWHIDSAWGLLPGLGSVVGIIFGSLFGVIAGSCMFGAGDRPVWRNEPINETRVAIPVFALLTATRLKEELQKLGGLRWHSYTLRVDRLVPAAERRAELAVIRAADPFLVLRVEDVDYYLEVWDEPGFARERKV